jgi:hypothetical protein
MRRKIREKIFSFCLQREVSAEVLGKEKIGVVKGQIHSHVEESEANPVVFYG